MIVGLRLLAYHHENVARVKASRAKRVGAEQQAQLVPECFRELWR